MNFNLVWALARSAVLPPTPLFPVPQSYHQSFNNAPFYGFAHFGVNTFTNKEWGWGNQDPDIFNPEAFNATQIVESFKQAGMKGVVLTAKHHDGFCLWPTNTTTHSIKYSKWRNGTGDVVRQFKEACQKLGMRFGVYVSPWDRNNAQYAREQYRETYLNQVKQLTTQYGKMFYLWFDGANGGDGYYGGANQTRSINQNVYYRWYLVCGTVKQNQPQANIYQGLESACRGNRWIGNQAGKVNDHAFSRYDGTGNLSGDRNGKYWMPAESDTSIRPGWFWHASQNSRVRSATDIMTVYLNTVGRGSFLNLNVPPNTSGLISPEDIASLKGFRQLFDKTFGVNLIAQAKVTGSNTRGGLATYSALNVLKDDDSYWAVDDGVLTASLQFQFTQCQFDLVEIAEYTQLGERVDQYYLDIWLDNSWKQQYAGLGVGIKRIVRLDQTMRTTKLRIRFERATATPCIRKVGAYKMGQMGQMNQKQI